MTDYAPLRIPSPSLPARSEEAPIDGWPPEEEGPELREYWRVLAKRRWLIGLVFAGVVGAIALCTFSATHLYSAEAVLLIEPSDPQVIDIKHVLGESFGYGSAYYNTQHEILRSRGLAAQVIREQVLAQEESFLAGSADPLAGLAALVSLPIRLVSSWLGRSQVQPEGDIERWLVDLYLHQLSIEPVFESRLVKLYFTSPDPELAARVVNAHARAYIAQGLALRTKASEEAGTFLEERLGELRKRLEESEVALNGYRREHGIVSLDEKSNVVIERLADLNQRLTAAETERIALEAEAGLVRERHDDSLPAVLQSSLVARLKEDLARLEGEYANLTTRFKPGYPRLVQLQAQIEEGRRSLHREVRSIVAGIESAYLAAQARERKLRAGLEEQKAEALRLEDAAVEYAILENDAETSRQLYDSVRQRIKETSVAAEIRASNIFVIDEATPPLAPSSPNAARNLAFGVLLGLLGGVGLALLAEYLDNRLRSPEDVERFLRLPSLGVVPDFAKLDGGWSRQLRANSNGGRAIVLPGRGRGELVPADEPPVAVTEAYRSIRTSILLSQAGEPPRTILFTSGTESEGKTTTALHTAVMFARLGSPVLVVDADLRRPSCHKVLGVKNGPGLTEILTGHDGRLRRIETLGTALSLLGSGRTPPNPTELLGSPRMREVLAKLRQRFEYILIDAPPLAPVSDSVVLSTLVDGVILVVDQKTTPRQLVRAARARLTYARAKVLGVVLNRTDPDDGAYGQFVPEYES